MLPAPCRCSRTLLAVALGLAVAVAPGCARLPGLAAPPAQVAADQPIADDVVLGVATSEQHHGVTTQGRVERQQLATDMGSFARTYPACTLSGTGSRVEFSLTRPAHGSDLLLELQEIHTRRPQAFGYTVAINGTEVYFRTYEEIGAGPNHYFVRIPADVAGAAPMVHVAITSAGAAPFSLGRVWLYSDFFTTTERSERIFRPVALMGMTATAPTVGGPGRDFAPFGEYRDVNFLNMPKAQVQQRIKDQLQRSAETGRPVEILLNGTTWGGAPKGPDGQGGYFTDIRYSLMAYDLASKSWSPSYPNMWSSTFWTSSYDPTLQAVMKERFLAGTANITATVDFLKARGQVPHPVYARELGPPLGEVNAATMAMAAKDGITLDPSDGLDDQERAWLHRTDVRLWQTYADWHAQAFPRDSVVVDRGQVRLPDEQTCDQQYAHTVFSTDQGPRKDRRWFGGQAGIVDGLWSSGEVHFDRFDQYDYVKANGKLGHVNIWAYFAKTPDLMRNLYDAGFQFATFIGDTDDTTKVIRAADGCADLPSLVPTHHLPVALEAMYNAQRTLGPADHILAINNLKIHSQSRECADMPSMSRLAVADVGKPGSITYRIDNGGEPFPGSLALQLDGRIAPGAGNRIQVLVGDSPERLQHAATITATQLPCPDHWTLYMTSTTTVDLGERLKGRKDGVVKLVFDAEGASDATFLMELKITGQWRQGSGHLASNPFTMREHRILNLWVQDRVVAERLVARYAKLAGEDDNTRTARRQMAEGRYRSVQRLLSGAISEILPARYAVRGHGKLGRHAPTVTLPQEDQALVVTLDALTPDRCAFHVATDSPRQSFDLALPADNGSRWRVTATDGQYLLVQDPAGTLVASNGAVVVHGEAITTPEPKVSLPHTLVVRYLDGNRSSIRVDTQDIALLRGDESLTLPVAPNATCTRSAERLDMPNAKKDWPNRYDRVELTLDDEGRVTALKASYGHDHGRIAKVTPFSPLPPFSNGTLTLDNGQTYEFDMSTEVDTFALHGWAKFYEAPMLLQALRPGMDISLEYSPYTERGVSRRLLRISQPHTVLMSQDFTTLEPEAWKSAIVSSEGVVVKRHNPEPHNGDNTSWLMRPAKPFVPGTVVYRVTAEQPLGPTALEFSARVYDDSSAIGFEASVDDGKTWTTCGRFDNTWQNCYPQSVRPWKVPWNFIDLSSVVTGKSAFLVRLTLRVHAADDRMALGALRVVTTKTP